MSSEPAQTAGSTETTTGLGELARALRRVAEGSSLDDVLRSIADATLVAAAADIVVVRVPDDEGGLLEARAVSASSTSVAAELQGSRTAADAGPDALHSAGQRLGFGVALELPIAFGDRELGRLELFRRARSFTAADEAIGRLAAEGKSVILVSSYLPELLGLCDTIAVMRRGVLVAVKPRAEWTEPELLRSAVGGD